MSYSKRQIIEAAMAELGLAAYSFDLMPEQAEVALRRLNSMMAEWNARGIRISFGIPNEPQNSNIDSDSNLPDYAWEAVITNLALRLAPSYGKVINFETKATARNALNAVMSKIAMPPQMQFPSMPIGAGHKAVDEPFSSGPVSELVAGQDAEIDLN